MTKYKHQRKQSESKGKPTSVEARQFVWLRSASRSCATTLERILRNQRKSSATHSALAQLTIHRSKNQAVSHLIQRHHT